MKVTRTVNLSGVVFHIDNDAYQALNDYLNDIELRLPTDERAEIMEDIEARVCELLQADLFARNVQVVDMKMVDSVKQHLGDPSEFGNSKRPRVKHSPRSGNSGCGRVIGISLLVLLLFSTLPVLVPLFAGLFAILIGLFGVSLGTLTVLPFAGVPFLVGMAWWEVLLAIVAILVAIILPIVVIVRCIVSFMRTRHLPKARFWIISLLCWIASLACVTGFAVKQVHNAGGIDVLIQQIDHDEDICEPDSTTYELPEEDEN